jgi:PAS domain-containing protein
MLAHEIDFHEVFRLGPTAMALLTADLAFIDANDAFLGETDRTLDDLIGHNFFEVFPKQYPGMGFRNALEEAITTEKRCGHLLCRYDIDEPGQPGSARERYWSVDVQPVRGSDGVLQAVELSARNITEVVSAFRAVQAEEDHLYQIISGRPGA